MIDEWKDVEERQKTEENECKIKYKIRIPIIGKEGRRRKKNPESIWWRNPLWTVFVFLFLKAFVYIQEVILWENKYNFKKEEL